MVLGIPCQNLHFTASLFTPRFSTKYFSVLPNLYMKVENFLSEVEYWVDRDFVIYFIHPHTHTHKKNLCAAT